MRELPCEQLAPLHGPSEQVLVAKRAVAAHAPDASRKLVEARQQVCPPVIAMTHGERFKRDARDVDARAAALLEALNKIALVATEHEAVCDELHLVVERWWALDSTNSVLHLQRPQRRQRTSTSGQQAARRGGATARAPQRSVRRRRGVEPCDHLDDHLSHVP